MRRGTRSPTKCSRMTKRAESCGRGFSAENKEIYESLSPDTQAALREAIESYGKERPDFLKPKSASAITPFKETYVAYSQFSGDAAHPTLTALRRHLSRGPEKTAYFDVVPEPKDEELDETLHLSCIALITVLVVANEMNGFTEAGKELPELNGELKRLQAERYGSASVAEGMDIRTEMRE
jgi:hypothetical protein